jgi:hypothetical protein
MEKQKNIVCGADIHKRFIMATILSRDGNKIRGRFGMTLDEILRFKEWVINNNCEAVAIESTGIYWVSIYTVLEGVALWQFMMRLLVATYKCFQKCDMRGYS